MLAPLNPISNIHWVIVNSPPTPPTPWKTRKRRKKNDDTVTIDTPLPPTHPTLLPPMLSPKILAPPTPMSHLHWEIPDFPPTPRTPWKTRKIWEIKLMIKIQFKPPLPPMHPEMIPPMILPKKRLHWIQFPIFIEKLHIGAIIHHHHEKPENEGFFFWMIKTHLTPPMTPLHLELIPPMLLPNIPDLQNRIYHIHW